MFSLRILSAGLALALTAAVPASALSVGPSTLDFAGSACDAQTVCARTVSGGIYDGVGAVFADPIVEAGTNDFFNAGAGLLLGSGGLGMSWTVVFDAEVVWTGGTLSYASNNVGFSVTGPGVSETALLSGLTEGPYSLGAGLTFLEGETYTFTSPNDNVGSVGPGGVAFETFVFGPSGTPVPLPAPVLMLGAGLAGLVALGRRRRGA
ncbi:VPLPA-CTERM sorting domain-containing protein [Albimonas sp. CAU 1670]|uniref:VPLPA-CTERM sorting domain-containing protein n=1 Tax=Albimonas sp. CAU 1670 TaxID=3032599 RepID=UPI0023DB3C9A|nr:VPLPA-CTERM sorting domain-containing protein [Albimonas sp. CAU 1670]MDF2231602.1 VPLPA-CTERM sorting domain-containing protein [Albimonas sp. CAU 1670]